MPVTRRTSPASPISPIATTSAATARSMQRAGERQREREVGGRLAQLDAADGGGVDLASCTAAAAPVGSARR